MSDVLELLGPSVALRAECKLSLALGGQTFPCRPPTRKEAMEWLDRIARCYEGDLGAIMLVSEGFPALVGLPEEAFEGLMPLEIVQAATRFFCSSRPGILDASTPSPTPSPSP